MGWPTRSSGASRRVPSARPRRRLGPGQALDPEPTGAGGVSHLTTSTRRSAVTPFSVGIGLTNECNLRCAHCYRPDMVLERLTLEDVQRACQSIPVRSVNLGVGENGLHPQYADILDYLWSLAIKT